MEKLNKKYKYWTEATEYIVEDLFIKYGGEMISNKYAQELLKTKTKVIKEEDGFHYNRLNRYKCFERGCIFGYNNEDVFKNVEKEIEERSCIEKIKGPNDIIKSVSILTTEDLCRSITKKIHYILKNCKNIDDDLYENWKELVYLTKIIKMNNL